MYQFYKYPSFALEAWPDKLQGLSIGNPVYQNFKFIVEKEIGNSFKRVGIQIIFAED